ncbi:hypothetical protein [Kingella sp. (in: b-proteobacteria)]|nr:hypothetical protein [Kingella sp. (in: b-proteobacteria)]MDO4656461.1 hypothetical protein [Kingella sp. (in: b-proteobacteria)]
MFCKDFSLKAKGFNQVKTIKPIFHKTQTHFQAAPTAPPYSLPPSCPQAA